MLSFRLNLGLCNKYFDSKKKTIRFYSVLFLFSLYFSERSGELVWEEDHIIISVRMMDKKLLLNFLVSMIFRNLKCLTY